MEYHLHLNPTTSTATLIGFMKVDGEYHSTRLRSCYEHGGTVILHDWDTAPMSVVTLVNRLSLATFPFPDGALVKRHPEFRIKEATDIE